MKNAEIVLLELLVLPVIGVFFLVFTLIVGVFSRTVVASNGIVVTNFVVKHVIPFAYIKSLGPVDDMHIDITGGE